MTAADNETPQGRLPKHVAIIMDGNGRWAQARGLPRGEGHRHGIEPLRAVCRAAVRAGVPYVSVYAFSSENWKRPADEVATLMSLFATVLAKEAVQLAANGVRLRVVGDIEGLPAALRPAIRTAELVTRACNRMTLSILVNYGGRWDIAQSVRRLIAENPGIASHPELVTEEAIASHMSMAYAPDPDLVIRTGGEQRLSNFLTWQTTYSELYITNTLWPDFGEAAFEEALAWFVNRERRFGATGDQVRASRMEI